MLILYLCLSVCSFLIGFILGALRKAPTKAVRKFEADSDLEAIQKEYENFLNYDGSMQQ